MEIDIIKMSIVCLCSVPGLARMHSLHFLLELEEPIHESLGSWRTAWDVDIHGNNPVAASDHGVAVVIVTSTVGTAAHAHHPSGLGHLVINLPKGWSHLVGQCSSHNDDICLSWGGSEHNTISNNNKFLKTELIHDMFQSNLSMSYLGAAICIISTAQQARPKVRGHNEP